MTFRDIKICDIDVMSNPYVCTASIHLPEVQVDPADQWNPCVPSVLSHHLPHSHPCHLEVLEVPGRNKTIKKHDENKKEMTFHDWRKKYFNVVCPTLNQNWAYGHSSGSSWSWGSSRSLWTLLMQKNLYLKFSYFHFSNCFMLVKTFYTWLKQIYFAMFLGVITHRLSSVSLFASLTNWTRSTRGAWSTRWSSWASVTTIALQKTKTSKHHKRRSHQKKYNA